jgi:hypothetical protein
MVASRLTAWLRAALALVAAAGVLGLTGCGGGNGAPNNPYNTPPPAPILQILPQVITVYSGIPSTITVTSAGVPPLVAFSSNPTVLPVAQNVAGNTIVLLGNQVDTAQTILLTVQDSIGQRAEANVTVTPSPLFNAFTFVPVTSDCGSNLCSGQIGTAKVTATGPQGAPLVGRQIRFDVVFGPVGIVTSNPASPLVQTLTVATDNAGVATASVQALANATTQPAEIRATDVTTGQQQIANFIVQNNTSANLSPIVIVPSDVNITGPTTTTCSAGFRVDFYVFGGSPPYTVASTFPQSISLLNTSVAAAGGFFSAVTNGSCVDPLTFTIVDSAGKQTTATLHNLVGTVSPPAPTPPPAIAITPAAVTNAACTGKTFNFVVSGGTPSYNITVSPTPPATVAPQILNSPGTVAVSGLLTGSGATNVIVLDSSNPKQTVTATITCQ